MSDTTLDDDLTHTQEYLIAGAVLLLFGLLYWFFNYGLGTPNDARLSARQQLIEPVTAVTAHPIETQAAEIQSGRMALMDEKPALASAQQAEVAQTPGPSSDLGSSPDKAVAESATDQQAASRMGNTTLVDPTPTPPPAAQMASQMEAATVPTATTTTVVKVAAPTQEASQPIQAVEATPSVAIEALPSKAEMALQEMITNNVLEKPVNMDAILFESGSTRIRETSLPQIQGVARLLKQYPSVNILITGHTDETGPSQTNTELSLLRANAMGLALAKEGIDKRRITIMGVGDKQPIDSNQTEEGRKHNRRIEISVIK